MKVRGPRSSNRRRDEDNTFIHNTERCHITNNRRRHPYVGGTRYNSSRPGSRLVIVVDCHSRIVGVVAIVVSEGSLHGCPQDPGCLGCHRAGQEAAQAHQRSIPERKDERHGGPRAAVVTPGTFLPACPGCPRLNSFFFSPNASHAAHHDRNVVSLSCCRRNYIKIVPDSSYIIYLVHVSTLY